MGEVRERQPVKFIASLLTGNLLLLPDVKQALEQEIDGIDFASPVLPFSATDYYEEEFGPNLQREIVSFTKLRDMADLAVVKRLTNDLEMRWAIGDCRKVNIDPGYIALGKFVLATTKDRDHRIYIGQGIFAEVTLSYRAGSFKAREWTYPDYASPQYVELLNALRNEYRLQLKESR
jgi:hypothetical protein